MADGIIHVEVAAALPQRQVLIPLEVPVGTTLVEAVERSGIARQLPDFEIDPGRMGIFGRVLPPETALHEGDRVEIYRPLTADPKEVRRQLAEMEKARRRRR
jgi:uncharacterized protein